MERRVGAPAELALTELAHARALRHRPHRRDHEHAERLARSARRTAARLGLAPALAEATRLLHELAGIDTVDVSALTAREREIAGLVADGLTNQAIAQRLVISDRTVESHVRNLTGKLGVTNRPRSRPGWSEPSCGIELRNLPDVPGRASSEDLRQPTRTEKIMFARLHTYHQPREDELLGWSRDEVAGLPGFGGAVVLATENWDAAALTLWGTRADAELLDERLPAVVASAPAQTAEIYEVDEDLAGPAADAQPTTAFLGQFDRPLSTAQIAAARRAGSERLAPELRRVPGLVRVLVLWHPLDRTMRVLHLAESREALAGVTRAVTTTPLLPGEDPALLPGPDRVRPYRVLAYRGASV